MRREFAVNQLNLKGLNAAKDVAVAFSTLADTIEAYGGLEDEYKKRSLEKLEEACFFAKKSIAMQKNYQVE